MNLSSFLSDLFEHIKACHLDVMAGERDNWVGLNDILLHTWCEEFLKNIMQNYSFILKNVRFDYARFIIQTSLTNIINHVIKIMIDHEIFNINIVEEP